MDEITKDILIDNVRASQYRKLARMTHGYKSLGVKYRLLEYPSRIIITFPDYPEKKYDLVTNYSRTEGVHIVKHVAANVQYRLDNDLYKPVNTDFLRSSIKTIFFNDTIGGSSLKSMVGREVVAVDIDSCYFNTLYNIGAIDERTYLTGFGKNKEYKNARNISVGSLNRVGRITVFDGLVETKETERKPTSVVRLDVIDTVYNIALRVARELGDSFLFFLTDCFFIEKDALQHCIALLEPSQYKYKVKHDTVKISKVTMPSSNYLNIEWIKSGAAPTDKPATYKFNRSRNSLSTQTLVKTGYFFD